MMQGQSKGAAAGIVCIVWTTCSQYLLFVCTVWATYSQYYLCAQCRYMLTIFIIWCALCILHTHSIHYLCALCGLPAHSIHYLCVLCELHAHSIICVHCVDYSSYQGITSINNHLHGDNREEGVTYFHSHAREVEMGDHEFETSWTT